MPGTYIPKSPDDVAHSAAEVGINRHDEYVGRGVKTPASPAENTVTYTLEFRQTEAFPGQPYPCSAMLPLLWLDECNGCRMGSLDPLTAGEDDDTPVQSDAGRSAAQRPFLCAVCFLPGDAYAGVFLPEERRGLSGDLPGHDVLGPGGEDFSAAFGRAGNGPLPPEPGLPGGRGGGRERVLEEHGVGEWEPE